MLLVQILELGNAGVTQKLLLGLVLLQSRFCLINLSSESQVGEQNTILDVFVVLVEEILDCQRAAFAIY